jgi:hypothetical protein
MWRIKSMARGGRVRKKRNNKKNETRKYFDGGVGIKDRKKRKRL